VLAIGVGHGVSVDLQHSPAANADAVAASSPDAQHAAAWKPPVPVTTALSPNSAAAAAGSQYIQITHMTYSGGAAGAMQPTGVTLFSPQAGPSAAGGTGVGLPGPGANALPIGMEVEINTLAGYGGTASTDSDAPDTRMRMVQASMAGSSLNLKFGDHGSSGGGGGSDVGLGGPPDITFYIPPSATAGTALARVEAGTHELAPRVIARHMHSVYSVADGGDDAGAHHRDDRGGGGGGEQDLIHTVAAGDDGGGVSHAERSPNSRPLVGAGGRIVSPDGSRRGAASPHGFASPTGGHGGGHARRQAAGRAGQSPVRAQDRTGAAAPPLGMYSSSSGAGMSDARLVTGSGGGLDEEGSAVFDAASSATFTDEPAPASATRDAAWRAAAPRASTAGAHGPVVMPAVTEEGDGEGEGDGDGTTTAHTTGRPGGDW
jgi:hypothetical protein